jgi:hypothetical protein
MHLNGREYSCINRGAVVYSMDANELKATFASDTAPNYPLSLGTIREFSTYCEQPVNLSLRHTFGSATEQAMSPLHLALLTQNYQLAKLILNEFPRYTNMTDTEGNVPLLYLKYDVQNLAKLSAPQRKLVNALARKLAYQKDVPNIYGIKFGEPRPERDAKRKARAAIAQKMSKKTRHA